ncbi:MAG: cysteine desulfurase, partial [Candidatus Eremiobacteraeota bacterium]|nr:cysteine desulfurase [Candidatus Eremiobacteraeota bacterium]
MAARIYADHAATTPVREEVIAAMLPYLGAHGFNASSMHAEGRAARAALDDARLRVAALLGAKPREIVFTGGGSEADNLAIVGAARANRSRGRHVVTAATEHHAVLHAFDRLREEGFDVTVLPVDGDGRVDPAVFEAALRPDTILVSLMLANNELGTLHPIPALARLATARGIAFHTDAVQAAGRVPLDVGALGVDLMTLTAHKFYGPKGVGMLYVRTGTALSPLIVGGGQEAGRRAGTENVSGIVGFARALELAVAELPA